MSGSSSCLPLKAFLAVGVVNYREESIPLAMLILVLIVKPRLAHIG